METLNMFIVDAKPGVDHGGPARQRREIRLLPLQATPVGHYIQLLCRQRLEFRIPVQAGSRVGPGWPFVREM